MAKKEYIEANIIKAFFYIMLIVIYFPLFGQTELEIKTGNDYFWGQSIDITEEAAKLSARDELVFTITDDLHNNPDLVKEKDVLVNGVKYLTFPRGPKFRVVAYILKSLVSNIQQGKTLEASEIIVKEDTIYNENTTIDTIQIKSAIKEDTVSIIKINKIYCLDTKNLIDCILQADTITQLMETFDKLRKSDKIIYNNFKTVMLQYDDTYFLVFDPNSGLIEALIDKGTSSNRINLKTNNLVSNFPEYYKQMKIIWLQIH